MLLSLRLSVATRHATTLTSVSFIPARSFPLARPSWIASVRALHVRVCPSPVSIQYPGKVDPRDFSMGVKKLSQHSTFGPPKDMNRTLPDGYLKKRTGEPTLPERTYECRFRTHNTAGA